MFNRVKSLIVSGVLVLGMAMPAFADGVQNPGNTNSNWKNCLIDNVGNHDDTTKIHKIEDADGVLYSDFETNFYNPIVNKTKDGLVLEKAADPDNKYDAIYHIYKDANYNNKKDDDEELLESIYANFADDVSSEKGWIPEITPGTGDALALGGLAVSAVAAGCLTIVNKKRNK